MTSIVVAGGIIWQDDHLLAALRPFVKEERFAKVDRAIQAARLARVVRAALRMFRESKEGGEGEHV